MNMIRQPDANPFETVHDQMYDMFFELSRRLEGMRAELRDRSQVQAQPEPEPLLQSRPQPPALVADVTPIVGAGVRTGKSNTRNKIRPHVSISSKTKTTRNIVVPPNGTVLMAPETQAPSVIVKRRRVTEIRDSDDEIAVPAPASRKRKLIRRETSESLGNSDEEVETRNTGAHLDGDDASIDSPRAELRCASHSSPPPTKPTLGRSNATTTVKRMTKGPEPSISKAKLKDPGADEREHKKQDPDCEFVMDNALLNRRLSKLGPNFQVDNNRTTHPRIGSNSRANMKLEEWVDDRGDKGPYHLFLHRSSEDYRYFGLYDRVWIERVSRDEWLSQSDKVRKSWAERVRSTTNGKSTRARVFLRRRFGREPTLAEVVKHEEDENLKRLVNESQIMEDFNSGIENLTIWGLKCVGYNYDLEQHLADHLLEANAAPTNRKDKISGLRPKRF
ncbi:hypothetical protein BDM02DRAFT_3189147 [Thelephora ganbajun]|uniref:Uncharacterized protein n=1 Tax=Thelephora ganbajun TaxID=370292 RepID=A0ACB6Z8Y7_THEGA|nr:hypothetical protein BDM02DRAFT_3189147 [Thelephora ganbajun]